jgi:hypothetical protein
LPGLTKLQRFTGAADVHVHLAMTFLFKRKQQNIRFSVEVVDALSPAPVRPRTSKSASLPERERMPQSYRSSLIYLSIPNVFCVEAPCNSDIGSAFNDRTAVGKYS